MSKGAGTAFRVVCMWVMVRHTSWDEQHVLESIRHDDKDDDNDQDFWRRWLRPAQGQIRKQERLTSALGWDLIHKITSRRRRQGVIQIKIIMAIVRWIWRWPLADIVWNQWTRRLWTMAIHHPVLGQQTHPQHERRLQEQAERLTPDRDLLSARNQLS